MMWSSLSLSLSLFWCIPFIIPSYRPSFSMRWVHCSQWSWIHSFLADSTCIDKFSILTPQESPGKDCSWFHCNSPVQESRQGLLNKEGTLDRGNRSYWNPVNKDLSVAMRWVSLTPPQSVPLVKSSWRPSSQAPYLLFPDWRPRSQQHPSSAATDFLPCCPRPSRTLFWHLTLLWGIGLEMNRKSTD